MDWLSALPACTVPAVVAVVLVAESGLLIGLVLPGSSLVIGVGVLAGAGLVPLPVAALTVAAATVGGAALGHRCAARSGSGTLLPTGGPLGRLLPGRVRRAVDRSASPWADAVARRPVRVAGMSQFVTGSRTLAPRIAARSGVPLPTMLRGTVPAALLWSWGLVALGAGAGAAAPLLNGMVALAGVPVVVAVTWLLLRRRARDAGAPQARQPTVPRRLRHRGWLPAVVASTPSTPSVPVTHRRGPHPGAAHRRLLRGRVGADHHHRSRRRHLPDRGRGRPGLRGHRHPQRNGHGRLTGAQTERNTP